MNYHRETGLDCVYLLEGRRGGDWEGPWGDPGGLAVLSPDLSGG